MQLPDRVVKAIPRIFPETGEQWLQNFDKYLTELLQRWQLTVEGQADSGWPTNIVYFVRDQNNRALVLKVGHPHPEAETERITLEAFNDKNLPVVRILDSAQGIALLLERIEPGTNLREQITNPDSIRAALELHQLFPQAPIKSLPTYSGWLEKAFHEYRSGRAPDEEFLGFIETAERLFSKIDTPEQFLLHGDLHHENILLGPQGWMVIDPKGVNGPKAMELGRFFHNFVSDEIDGEATTEAIQQVFRERFTLGSQVLPYSELDIAQITFVDLSLALTWHLNSGEDGTKGLALLRALSVML